MKRRKIERQAETVRYDRAGKRVEILFTDGVLFAFPAELGQGLAGATPAELAEVALSPGRRALHWERLDVDLEIAGLVAGVFGTRAWMQELGRRVGSVTSERKARAARSNGARGGRPRAH
jgi:hypothetical protein